MTRQMVDSAFPLKTQPQPLADIVLVYSGGDTPHPWSKAEIAAQPNRYRFPCWVRSNPQSVNVVNEVAAFVAWLHDHNVPKGTCVILDLETAVNAVYVSAFNKGLAAAGYKTVKYGSRSTIWKNPQTDGGTFVAWPDHPNEMDTTGDTVAVQYLFHGDYDMSIVLGQAAVPLWDTHPPEPPAPVTPGHVAYKAYGSHLNWHDKGKPLPWWGMLSDRERAGWEAAAKAVTP
jgi:hypothetical protein